MSSRTILEAADLYFGYRDLPVLRGVSFAVSSGEFVGLLGPNGTGKSTLLRILSSSAVPSSGAVTLNGELLSRCTRRDLARTLAFLPQRIYVDFPFSCIEIVHMGRAPHQGLMGIDSARDHQIVKECMALTRTSHLALRSINEISGGEAQRVFLAQALAQEGELLLLDEPISHLDIKYSIEMLDLLKTLQRDQEKTVILSIHDLNLAAMYCTRIILLHEGRVIADGTPRDVLTVDNLQRVFDVKVERMEHLPHHPCIILLLPAAAS